MPVESRRAISHMGKAVWILMTVKQAEGSACQNTVYEKIQNVIYYRVLLPQTLRPVWTGAREQLRKNTHYLRKVAGRVVKTTVAASRLNWSNTEHDVGYTQSVWALARYIPTE